MSKLISRLEKLSKGTSSPMGFGPRAKAEKMASIAFIGLVTRDHEKGASSLAKAGVDGVLIEGVKSDGKLSNITAPLKDVPWGLKLEEVDRGKAQDVLKQGCDFLVTPADKTPLEALEDDKAAFLPTLSIETGDQTLRGVEELPIEAVYLSGPWLESPLTLQHLISIGSIRSMLDKFLLVEVPPKLSAKQIETLRDMGIDGVVLKADGLGEKELVSFKETIDGLPRQKRGKGEKVGPALSKNFQPADPTDYEDEDV